MFNQETSARRLIIQASSAGDRLIKSVLYLIHSRGVVFYELTSDELTSDELKKKGNF
jgi:hypothetical protein